MENTNKKPQSQVPVNNLSGKDVGDFGKEVAKDSLKQGLVWAAAGFIAQVLRSGVDKFTKKN